MTSRNDVFLPKTTLRQEVVDSTTVVGCLSLYFGEMLPRKFSMEIRLVLLKSAYF